MYQQLDLFGVLFELNEIDKIRAGIEKLKEFETIETCLCTIEKARRFYVVKTNDFDKTFFSSEELIEFVERGSTNGWDVEFEN